MLKDKVTVISGGTSGIGYATALKMQQSGALVYACARHEREFSEENIWYHFLDVTDSVSCRKLMENVLERHGRIDVLVADAGITKDCLTVKMTDEAFDDVMNTNLKGIFNLVKYIGPSADQYILPN